MRRRDFLERAAAAGLALRGGASRAAGAPAGNPFDRAMRWGQLAFVENDPGRYDRAFWLDYFRRTHLDAVTLSAGGVVAFYPTTVPFHHRSEWMKDGMDPFGELTQRLPPDGHDRRRARGPARGLPGRRRRAPRVDRGGRQGRAAAALGQPRAVGDLRARPLQLRIHAGDPPRDRHALRRAGRVREPLGRPRHVSLRELPPPVPAVIGNGPARRERRRPGPPAVHPVEAEAADRALGRVGRGGPGGAARRALHPQRPAGDGERAARALPGHRQPGPARPHAAVGVRALGQAVPGGDGNAARWPGSSASASRSRIAGRTPCRPAPRCASGRSKGSPTACGPGSRSSPACSTTRAG